MKTELERDGSAVTGPSAESEPKEGVTNKHEHGHWCDVDCLMTEPPDVWDLIHEYRSHIDDIVDAAEIRAMAEQVRDEHPEATSVLVEDYDDGNGPDAYLHVFDGDQEIDGYISSIRPDSLVDEFTLDIEETLAIDLAAVVDSAERRLLAALEAHRSRRS